MNDLARLDAIAQADLVRAGEVTPLELVDAAIGRIEALNGRLNAVVTPLYGAARTASQAPLPDGPLAGVPFLVKDLGASMAGVPETMGSRALRDHRPPRDNALVGRYRAAGLLILGRTNTPEFGNHSTTEPALFGAARNPWDPALTAGGSSGGSAVAVASGMVPAAHGGDGAGSLRIPASCCGVFGLKPTRGRVSMAPGGDEVWPLNVRHAITRSVRDSAALLDIEAGRVPGDPYPAAPPARPFLDEVGRDPGRLRIGWTATATLDVPVDSDCADAVREAARLLASLGHDVEEAVPAFDGEVLVGPLGAVWALGNLADASFAERFLGRPLGAEELEITTWELVEHARELSPLDILEAVGALGAAARGVAPFFETYDVWLTPTLARRPEPLGVLNRSYGGALAWQRFDCSFNPWNPIANITGNPAMSLPLHWTADGIPIGVLATGRFGDEATLFRLAGQLEAARPWADRLPPIHASAGSGAPSGASVAATGDR
jgi:amidase